MLILPFLLLWLGLLQGVLAVNRTSNNQLLDNNESLLHRFRFGYQKFLEIMQDIQVDTPDSFLLRMLGEELTDFRDLVSQNHVVFEAPELLIVQSSIEHMLHDVGLLYDTALQTSHRGHLEVVRREHTGGRGRPRIVIDRNFLAWAYRLRSASGIAKFLGVGRTAVRQHLLEFGIAPSGFNPFPDHDSEESESEESQTPPEFVQGSSRDGSRLPSLHHPLPTPRNRAYLSDIADNEIDARLAELHKEFPQAGLSILDGMLKNLGIFISRERMRQSLLRIDPVTRIFDRIRLKHRGYSVPGPNSLWHHDGQHGLIRWGIVIHAFIDGYSRMITGIRASPNNLASTVLALFLDSTSKYGIPSRVRGDHGVENVLVAAFMEIVRGEGRGSYIWGRSVHNTRIERLWADVTIGVGATWRQHFTTLEVEHGLQHDNPSHIWLLQHLFLPTINNQLRFWAESWNFHPIMVRGGPRRRPEDMFGFDMLIHGSRGDPLEEHLTPAELEAYGIDWDAFQNDAVLQQLRSNYGPESSSSWLGRRGPPPELSEVIVPDSSSPLSSSQVDWLNTAISGIPRTNSAADVINLWTRALMFVRILFPDDF